MQHKKIFTCIILLLFAGCLPGGLPKEKKLKEDKLLFSQAQKALSARDYMDAIELFEIFIERFPDSDGISWAYQRLGESFEGLLQVEYFERMEKGEAECSARKEFLARFGTFGCWKESNSTLSYNGNHYRHIITKFPDSPIADEAAYRLVPRSKDYGGMPDGPLKELKALKQVLEKFPSTSFRPEILYKMAHRCHILYEIYSFSPDVRLRDKQKAGQYRDKAAYLYKLSFSLPDNSKYSQKAWSGLRSLDEGKRIYIH